MEQLSSAQWKTELDEVVQQVEEQQRPRSEMPTVAKAQDLSPTVLASYIDHTVLKLDATEAEVIQLCDEAREFKFAAVCVRLNFVPLAKAKLAGTNIPIACVVGFHEGTQSTQSKLDEASSAIQAGATELDVVLNRQQLTSGDFASVFNELRALRQLADNSSESGKNPVHLKLILETSALDTRQIIQACALAGWAGWDYVKTSTGFHGHGATAEHVRLMRLATQVMAERVQSRELSLSQMKVKASGGIRTYQDAITMVSAGADRLGASAGVKLVHDAQAKVK